MNPRSELFETFAIQGMSLRDYFAAKAMQAFIHSFSYRKEENNSVVVPDNLTNHAYVMADLMMKARAK